MGQRKGQTGNKNGRPKGATGKLSGDLRSKINSIIENNIETIQSDIDSLEPIQRLQIFEKLLKYALPTLQAQSFDVDFSTLSESQLNQIINNINLQNDDGTE
jgi:hypothetical protein